MKKLLIGLLAIPLTPFYLVLFGYYISCEMIEDWFKKKKD